MSPFKQQDKLTTATRQEKKRGKNEKRTVNVRQREKLGRERKEKTKPCRGRAPI
jgi:hypothetical protein